ncbi:MAG: hypothetical protein MI747_00045, partial [Desulfobacterales bacterium]|nr:hypothetical protein [Desulfobacterales bacterium]
WPVEMIPDYLEKMAMVVPSVPGTEGFIRIFTMGADLIQVRDDYLVLWGLALAYFLLAALRFWRIGKNGSRVSD